MINVWKKISISERFLGIIMWIGVFYIVVLILFGLFIFWINFDKQLGYFLYIIPLIIVILIFFILLKKSFPKPGLHNIIGITIKSLDIDHNLVSRAIEMALENSNIEYLKSIKSAPSTIGIGILDIYDIEQYNCTIQLSSFVPHTVSLSIGSKIKNNKDGIKRLKGIVNTELSKIISMK